MTTQQQISNKVFLSQIDGALKHEDIPRVKLNKLIDMAHARLTCDDECQKKEKNKKLKKNGYTLKNYQQIYQMKSLKMKKHIMI